VVPVKLMVLQDRLDHHYTENFRKVKPDFLRSPAAAEIVLERDILSTLFK